MPITELITAIRVWQPAMKEFRDLIDRKGYWHAETQVALLALQDIEYQIVGVSDIDDDVTIPHFMLLANEVERLRAIEARAVSVNNALLTAIQSMMQYLTPEVRARFEASLRDVVSEMEKS